MALCDQAIRRPALLRAPKSLIEVGMLGLLYASYSAVRSVVTAAPADAVAHAQDVLHVERFLHLDVELVANRALQSMPDVALFASYWYAVLHYAVTLSVLVWVYRCHHAQYQRARNVLVVTCLMGLAGFVLVPMAPPRLLTGYVDTLHSTSASGWWGADASAPKGLGSLTNEFAAMPSLHVGWAIWCMWVVMALSTNRALRRIMIAYAVGTSVVVVATANHFVLDAVAGVAVVILAVRLVDALSRYAADNRERLRQLRMSTDPAPVKQNESV